ncbi:MAG: hypothetical protein DCC58_11675 [Chloroflexi bacterium]|nr:MAG: hypothetical protein DCC58_11675 [Chloroflexota bacterium]
MSWDPQAMQSTPSEAIRTLRSTIKFAGVERPIRSILVVDIDRQTPSGVAEGLAQAFGNAGDACILIDSRDRAPVEGDEPSLARLIVSPATLPVRVGEPLRVPGGADLNADALASDGLSAVIQRNVAEGAFVIVACRSAPSFSDAVSIAPRVDATILVVSAGKSRRAKAVEARDALARVGARLMGVVMVEAPKRWFW